MIPYHSISLIAKFGRTMVSRLLASWVNIAIKTSKIYAEWETAQRHRAGEREGNMLFVYQNDGVQMCCSRICVLCFCIFYSSLQKRRRYGTGRGPHIYLSIPVQPTKPIYLLNKSCQVIALPTKPHHLIFFLMPFFVEKRLIKCNTPCHIEYWIICLCV